MHFYREDILHPVSPPEKRLHCIVSNPPYIPLSEKKDLQPEVREHEPPAALFVPDRDPLLFYRAIATFAGKYLAREGLLMVECHEKYAEAVKLLFEQQGFDQSEVIRDINGKERFVTASNSK